MSYEKRRYPYLEKRRRRWYAVLEIPKSKREHFNGKARFVQSLGTEDLRVARSEVWRVVDAWKRMLEPEYEYGTDYRGRPRLDPTLWARDLREAKAAGDIKQVRFIEDRIIEVADDIGYENVPQIGMPPSSDPVATRYALTATGLIVKITEHLDEWLSTSQVTAKTKDMQRSDVERFAARFPEVGDVHRPEVRRWITELMNDDGLTPKTVQRILSALRGYWRYLQSIGVADDEHEPFSRLDVARQSKRTAPRSKRQPFEPADVLRLLDTAIEKGDDQLADLTRLGMYTGCRIEELCALKTKHVADDHFKIVDAKTEAGVRDVPTHRELAQTMARMVDQSRDGYVLSRLTTNKYGDRSNAIGKKFGKLKTAQGFGPQYVFHSIRKTVVTMLENAGVPENVVADIVGHEKPTMTYGLYSGGVSLAVKAEALAKLRY
jgi:integrase